MKTENKKVDVTAGGQAKYEFTGETMEYFGSSFSIYEIKKLIERCEEQASKETTGALKEDKLDIMYNELLQRVAKGLKSHTLYRIRALRDFGDVKAGDLGGWIENEETLSHEGDRWANEDARLYYEILDDDWAD